MENSTTAPPSVSVVLHREPEPFKDLPAAARRALECLEVAVTHAGGDPREHEACCQLREALAVGPEIRSSRQADGNAAILFRETILALTQERDLVVSFEMRSENTVVVGCGGDPTGRFLCTIAGDGDGWEWTGGGDELPTALAAAVAKLPGRG